MKTLLFDLSKYSDIIFYDKHKTNYSVIDLTKCFILCDKTTLTIVINETYMVIFNNIDKMLEFFEDINFILIYYGFIKKENSFTQLIKEIKEFKENSK